MFQVIVILTVLLITSPACADQELVAFVGALRNLGKNTGQVYQKSGEKIDQSTQRTEKQQPKKKKTANDQAIGESRHMENKLNNQTKENDKIKDGNDEQMEGDYQFLNGRNDKVEGNKDFEILR